jgi:hypothetical protein
MPSIHGPLDSDGLALIDVMVAPVGPRVQALLKAGYTPPAAIPVRAILDIAAGISCIDETVRRHLGINPFSVLPIRQATGPEVECRTFKVLLKIRHPDSAPGSPLDLRLPSLEVIMADPRHPDAHVLLGTDVLAHCRLNYDGLARTFRLDY